MLIDIILTIKAKGGGGGKKKKTGQKNIHFFWDKTQQTHNNKLFNQ